MTFSLLVKPASADCNLQCSYCFYLDRKSLYPGSARHRMSDEVLDRMIGGYMATRQPAYSFGWQGGEPTLMGPGFFRRVTALQQKHGRAGAVVANGLQTNATLIDDELAEHLARYRFLVGVSLDGPEPIHDRYRVTVDGRGSHARVLQGLETLRRHGVEFNVLVLVTRANAERPAEIYRYLLDLGVTFHQYIPCVEVDEAGHPQPYSVDGRLWGEFLCGVFDEWARGDVRRVSVRHFDSVLSMLVDGTYGVCHMGTSCCQYFVVEHNGDVYPCDFYVTRALRLGNVMSDGWESLAASPAYRAFGAQKRQWGAGCEACPFLRLCAGDCLKHRLHAGHPSNTSLLCEGWKHFYGRTLPAFEALACGIRRDRAAARRGSAVAPAASGPVGRNDLCPCGSGRKHKHCCGR